MKRLIALMFILISSSVSAEKYVEFDEDPKAMFNAEKKMTSMSLITWRTVKNPTKACDEERKRNGQGPYGYMVDGCSFWDKTLGVNTCIIITGKKTNLHTMGHEMRHCFAGAYHKDFTK